MTVGRRKDDKILQNGIKFITLYCLK